MNDREWGLVALGNLLLIVGAFFGHHWTTGLMVMGGAILAQVALFGGEDS